MLFMFSKVVYFSRTCFLFWFFVWNVHLKVSIQIHRFIPCSVLSANDCCRGQKCWRCGSVGTSAFNTACSVIGAFKLLCQLPTQSKWFCKRRRLLNMSKSRLTLLQIQNICMLHRTVFKVAALFFTLRLESSFLEGGHVFQLLSLITVCCCSKMTMYKKQLHSDRAKCSDQMQS